MKKTLIAPSILSADFSKIDREIERITQAGADLIHLDVMDGIFVPNISFGQKFIKDIRKITKLPLDVHLMIDRPERYIDQFVDAGSDYITVHFEATLNLIETLEKIKKAGVKCGAVINPQTDITVLENALPLCDMVLLMSVNPGFGGQKFIEGSLARLKALAVLVKKKNPDCLVEIDGGITLENADAAIKAGADILVAGNTVFSASDMAGTISRLSRGDQRPSVPKS